MTNDHIRLPSMQLGRTPLTTGNTTTTTTNNNTSQLTHYPPYHLHQVHDPVRDSVAPRASLHEGEGRPGATATTTTTASWNAINQPSANHTSNFATTDDALAPAPAPAPAPLPHAHQFYFVNSSSSYSPPPPRNPPSIPEPIRNHHQNSAPSSESSMVRNTITSILHHTNPDSRDPEMLLFPNPRETASYPNTPPSPAPSPEAQPAAPQEGREQRKMSLMSMLTPDEDAPPTRTRALSDPKSDGPSNPAPSTPRRTNSSSRHTPTLSTMPPPKTPVSVSAPTATTQQSPLGSSPLVQSQDAVRPVRCYYCNEHWKSDRYWTTKPQEQPSSNLAELEHSTARVLAQWDQKVKESRMYDEWAQQHRVDPKDENSKEPCPASKSSPKKRKADFEEPPVEAKLRRLSCDSPLIDPLTPPPDPLPNQPTTSAPPPPSTLRNAVPSSQMPNNKNRERYDMVAVLLKDPNVKPHYEPPIHNMFSLPNNKPNSS